MLQHEDCSPPVPDSMLMAPADIMDTEAPTADQDPSTGYPSPATSGHSSAARAAHHNLALAACQKNVTGQDSFSSGKHGLSLGADTVPPSTALITSRPRSLPIALSPCKQYQQAWQLQQQEDQLQDFNTVVHNKSICDGGCTSGQSYSHYRSSPVPSQDPPTGYPTPCASFDDNNASMSSHDGTLLASYSDARLEKYHGCCFFGNRLASRFYDASEAIADLGVPSRRLQHETSCHNTPVPSQDPPSEHSEAGDDDCSSASGNRACSVGHHVTAPSSPVFSQEDLAGVEDEDGINGSYADDVVDNAPLSPVPSQDAPSEYPDPQTPASSAEESEAQCSAKSSDLSREPLPPGVEISETHATATLPGDPGAAMSHALFCHAMGRLPLNTNTSTGCPYSIQWSWWEILEEQRSLDCVWDDYESGDESVGSPCRL